MTAGADPAVTTRSGGAPRRRLLPLVRTADWSTGRKVLASFGVVAVWAGLVGLGTFGTFTDDTTPLDGGVGHSDVSFGRTAPGSLGGR